MQRPFLVLGVELADGRARLDRSHHQALIDQRQPHDMRGLGEGFGDLVAVAVVIVERDIARHIVPELRRARLGRFARADTAGSGSMSSATASAASLACAMVSAITQATGSPTKRTLSPASAGRGV